jgi:TonB family protein
MKTLAPLLLVAFVSRLLASDPSRVVLSQEKMRDVTVHRVEPQYPPQALSAGLEGPVVVAVLLGQNASVTEAKPRCGDAQLEPAAVDAVQHWQFRSVAVKGKPVEIVGEVVVDFELPNRASSPTVIHVSSQAVLSNLISSVPPIYPQGAAFAKIQGCVIVRSLVGVDGKVKTTKTIAGHPMLAPAAETSTAQTRYKPFTKDGAAVEAETYQIVNFSLRN